MSDKACAVEVETIAPTTSKLKHVTIAINKITNDKPFESNLITNWVDVNPISLHGRLKFYYKN
jgi:hypothetical protein